MNEAKWNECKRDFEAAFSQKAERTFFASGRVELIGNHTDHQNGAVLTAAVDRYLYACAAVTEEPAVTLVSDGYLPCTVGLFETEAREQERFSTIGLLRGAVALLEPYAQKRTGVRLAIRSEVPGGSGLSSSAAFSVLVLTVLNAIWEAERTPMELAGMAKDAERLYFGKPCGWMDPAAIALGGVRHLDFSDPHRPQETEIPLCLEQMGLSMAVLDIGVDHADLSEAYASIVEELRAVSRFFGKQTLSEVEETSFFAALPSVRAVCGDRAVLRAMHVYSENKRVEAARDALCRADKHAFLQQLAASGSSSMRWLKNIEPEGGTDMQPLTVALAVLERLVGTDGAVRVHGGGFGGTILCVADTEKIGQILHLAQEQIGANGTILHSVAKSAGEWMEDRA